MFNHQYFDKGNPEMSRCLVSLELNYHRYPETTVTMVSKNLYGLENFSCDLKVQTTC